jgi:hypothetical protein
VLDQPSGWRGVPATARGESIHPANKLAGYKEAPQLAVELAPLWGDRVKEASFQSPALRPWPRVPM